MVDIRGGNTLNRGAELMLRATVEELAPVLSLSAPPIATDFLLRCELGLHQSAPFHKFPRLGSQIGDLLPGKVKSRLGLVSDADLAGVVDISGFGYTDVFPAEHMRREAIRAQRWARLGVHMVFLPQAYGPFTSRGQRRACSSLLSRADLLFVRDRVSLKYLRDLLPTAAPVLSPDFTIGLRSSPPVESLPEEFIGLVPNTKIIEKGVASESVYVARMAVAGQSGRAHGLEPVVVIHETTDASLGQRIAQSLECTVVDDPNPLVLKGVLGAAKAVVGSRFHAIVGALSQEVPTLVTGWSHKYAELLNDFAVPGWLLQEDDDMTGGVSRLLRDDAGRDRLGPERDRMMLLIDEMWERTREVLTSPR